MFVGQYNHSFDEKGRLTVPARFREMLAEGAYATQGFDRNLMVLTNTAFQLLFEHINAMKITDPMARLLRRMIIGKAFQIDIDKSGRILLPQYLREYATLQEEAILVGQGNYFEIWTPALWQEQEAKLQDAETNAQRFSTLNVTTG